MVFSRNNEVNLLHLMSLITTNELIAGKYVYKLTFVDSIKSLIGCFHNDFVTSVEIFNDQILF